MASFVCVAMVFVWVQLNWKRAIVLVMASRDWCILGEFPIYAHEISSSSYVMIFLAFV